MGMDQYSNSATRQLVNLGGGFGRWIKVCIIAFADDLAGSTNDSVNSSTMIRLTGDQAEIYNRSSKTGGYEFFSRNSCFALKGKSIRGPVVLRIDSDRAVVKQVSLPAGALDVMPAVIRNKVESLAPWPLHQVMWGYRLLDSPQSGQVDVEVAIMSRKALASLLSVFHNADIKVTHFDVASPVDYAESIAIDFQGQDRLKKAWQRVTAVIAIAGLVTFAGASLGLYFALSTQGELSAVERRSTDLKQKLLNGGGDSQANSKLVEANKLYERKKNNRPVVIVLNALSRLVPNGTWLNSVDYTGNQVTITGRGTEITTVIESLEKSDIFSDVNFASATQRDANANADIFSISATIETQGAAQ
jgi:general secretion pathway protein L